MTTLTYDAYEMICDVLYEHEELELEEIAEMTGFTLEEVKYVASAEEL